MSIHDAYKDELEDELTDSSTNENKEAKEVIVDATIVKSDIIQSKLPHDIQNFESDKYRLAASCDQQVAAGSWIAANALYTIKKYDLYKLIGNYENMDDMINERYPFIGIKTAKKFMRIVETLGQGPEVKELFASNNQKKLLEITRIIEKEQVQTEDGKEFVIVNGEKIEKDVYAKQIADKIEADFKAKIDSLESKVDSLEGQKNSLDSKLTKANDKLAAQDKKINAIAKAKSIDPNLVQIIADTTEAKNKITECLENVSLQFDLLENIPMELRNSHLATEILQTVAMIQHRIKGLQKNWVDHIELIAGPQVGE